MRYMLVLRSLRNDEFRWPFLLASCFLSERHWTSIEGLRESQTNLGMSFSTTMRMVYRIHRLTKYVRFNTLPSLSSSLTDNDVFMIFVTKLTNSSKTFFIELSYLSRRHLNKHQLLTLIFTDNLSIQTSRLDHLSFRERRKLKIEYLKPFWNVFQLLSVSRSQSSLITSHEAISYRDTFPSKHISFLSICKAYKSDTNSSVRIIFDSSHFCRYIHFVIPSKVNYTIELLVSSPSKSRCRSTILVSSSSRTNRLSERFLWSLLCDIRKVISYHRTSWGSVWFIRFHSHNYESYVDDK